MRNDIANPNADTIDSHLNPSSTTKNRNWAYPKLLISACFTSDSGFDRSSLVDKYDGRIFVRKPFHDGAEPNTNQDEPEVLAGAISAQRVCIAQAMSESAPIYDVIDVTQTVMDYCGPLLEADGEFGKRVQKLFDGEVCDLDVVLITEVLIRPEFRGSGLGLWAMRLLMEKLSPGAGLIVIKPFPLQFDLNTLENPERCNEYGIRQLPSQEMAATRKLKRYYSKLGFKCLPGTPLMLAATALRWPSWDDLGLSGDELAGGYA